MKIILVVLLIVLLLLLWLLLAQIRITIDSRQKIYKLSIASIGYAKVKWENEWPEMDARVLFWKHSMELNPSIWHKSPSKKASKKPTAKKERKMSYADIQHRIKRVLYSFRLEAFRVKMDTDNYYYNSLMYPLFFFARKKNMNVNINYHGQNEFLLILKNRPIRILFALYF